MADQLPAEEDLGRLPTDKELARTNSQVRGEERPPQTQQPHEPPAGT